MKHVISLYSLVKYFVKWIQGANILCMLFQSIVLGISHICPCNRWVGTTEVILQNLEHSSIKIDNLSLYDILLYKE